MPRMRSPAAPSHEAKPVFNSLHYWGLVRFWFALIVIADSKSASPG